MLAAAWMYKKGVRTGSQGRLETRALLRSAIEEVEEIDERESSVPGTPLTAQPLNRMVQGGGFRDAEGFPVMPDLHTSVDGHPRIKLYRLEDSKSGV